MSMKNVLMIAYEFPPLNFSGTARPFGFTRHLADFGYYPTVLTRLGTGIRSADEGMLEAIDGKCDIVRASVGDNDDWPEWLKHKLRFVNLPFRMLGLGKHRISEGLDWRTNKLVPGLMDYVHWTGPAIEAGKKIIKQRPVDLIWATGKPYSSLIAGYVLSKWSGLPLVVDIRDPWTYGVQWNPATKRIGRWHVNWERKILKHARRVVFTSELTSEIYRKRVKPEIAAKVVTITNGFDEFNGEAKRDVEDDKCLFRFLGTLPACRDPKILIEGMKRASAVVGGDQLVLEFIGNLFDFESIIDGKMVRHVPMVSQQVSKEYMRGADVLVSLQVDMEGGGDVISGKAYEYLSAGRPILGVVPEDGGDAWLIRETGGGIVTGASDVEKVTEGILKYFHLWKEKKLESGVDPEILKRFDRRNLTADLAKLFDDVLGE